MLGFDATGRLALGQIRRESFVQHLKTVTANVDAAAAARKAVAIAKVGRVSGSAAVRRAVAAARVASVDAAAAVRKAVVRVPIVAFVDAAAPAVLTPINRVIQLVASVAARALQVIVEAQNITSTRVLHNPVDYFMANLPQYSQTGRTYEPGYGKAGTKTLASRGGGGRIAGPAPSSKTTTTKRGYD